MRLTTMMLLLALGLLSAVSVQGFDLDVDHDDDDFDLDFDDDDFDLDMDDDDDMAGISLDEAIQKSNQLRVLEALIAEGEAMDQSGHIQKRFIFGILERTKEKLKQLKKKLGEIFSNAAAKAKALFATVSDKISFQSVVAKILPSLTNGMTVAQCKAVCESNASEILGPAFSLAATVCSPVCDGALAKLQEIAG